MDGSPTLIDFKTSGAIYDDHLYQLAGYYQLLTENGYEVDTCLVLRLSRDDGEEYEERIVSGPAIQRHFAVFLAALSLHNAIRLTTKRGAW